MPLLDRLAKNVRGALWGLVTGLFMAVLVLAGYIWTGHLDAEGQSHAELSEAQKKFESETEEYKLQQAEQLTKRLAWEARRSEWEAGADEREKRNWTLLMELTREVAELKSAPPPGKRR